VALIVDENGGCAPALLKQGAHHMQKRRRFKQSTALKDRLASFAKEARESASKLPAGAEKEQHA
jgi:hypothetical protein